MGADLGVAIGLLGKVALGEATAAVELDRNVYPAVFWDVPLTGTSCAESEDLVTVERGGVTPFSAPLAQGPFLAGEVGPTGCWMDSCCGGVTSASVAPSIP